MIKRYRQKLSQDILANILFVITMFAFAGLMFFRDYIPETERQKTEITITKQELNTLHYTYYDDYNHIFTGSKLLWADQTQAIKDKQLTSLSVTFNQFMPEEHYLNNLSGFYDLFKISIVTICVFLAIISLIFPWVTMTILVIFHILSVGLYINFITAIPDILVGTFLLAFCCGMYVHKKRIKNIGIKYHAKITNIMRDSMTQTVNFTYSLPDSTDVYFGHKEYPIDAHIPKDSTITIYVNPKSPEHHTVIT